MHVFAMATYSEALLLTWIVSDLEEIRVCIDMRQGETIDILCDFRLTCDAEFH